MLIHTELFGHTGFPVEAHRSGPDKTNDRDESQTQTKRINTELVFSSSLTVPVNDKICNCDVACIQGANVLQLLISMKWPILILGLIKRHKQNLCFVWLFCWFKCGQLNTDWMFEVFEQALQLKDTHAHR